MEIDRLWDSYEQDDERPDSRTVECKRCGKGGLHWEELDDGFRLYDGHMKKHECVMDCSGDFDAI
jgi:hypothetical protein